MIRPALALAAALAAAGCAPLSTLRSVATPSELYSLTPKSRQSFDPTLPSLDRVQIVVEIPTATAAVNTDRIAVQPEPLRVQYFPGARWVDRAPLFIQTLLIESFENSGKVSSVGRSTVGLRADYLIVTDIREFQAQFRPAATDEGRELFANVRLNVKVVDADLNRIVASESFTDDDERAESTDIADVAVAFDEALGDAMRDAVEWSIRVMAEQPPPRPRRF